MIIVRTVLAYEVQRSGCEDVRDMDDNTIGFNGFVRLKGPTQISRAGSSSFVSCAELQSPESSESFSVL